MSARTIEQRHLRGQVPLRDYFDSDEDMVATLTAVQFKVVTIFLKATHPKTGRSTGLDNHISGLDDRLSGLQAYVLGRIRLQREFWFQHLPRESVQLTREQWREVLKAVHARLVETVLVGMCKEQNLWRIDGDWCFSQVLRTEHDRAARLRSIDVKYHDERSFHGRPSKQGRRRSKQLGMAPGTSIGVAS